MGQSVVSYRGERVARPTERIGLREWDEILRYAQDDRRRNLVRCGRRGRGRLPRYERDYRRGAREVRQAAKAMILRHGEVASDE